ncbi:putative oxidoreductase [Dulcicalothrix desertica PCC 7102]|uniref:Putative oxidoreductase n=1 Tax=Dulcicalothrix desertica PCC 7102 TaxID=232991 RepID=A0A3S1DBH7_9CYAN|nr:NAD(P)-dependent oxidoreductase [Dulcicalothrix desertica]RUT06969.1 putative oxidoreductase [Dulcicalothrix desertica PCC 7102]TWH62031.1 nucleoside-diphosphate-sugar epimerase [Dulcicalothrix desertica PCC 7102]
MNQTILITGINECIGQRAAELAIQRGMKVKGFQLTPDKNKQNQLGIDVITGDINDSAILEKACQGVDIVLHAAEITKEGGKLKDFQKVNVDGTVTLARAAKKAGAKTFIHMSSVLVYGFDYSNNIAEDGKLKGDNNPYCQTKIEAEDAILKFNDPSFGVVIIRAGDVYGPGSIPWVVRPVTMMRQNMFACVNDGKGVMNHVYIDNLVEAVFLAIEKQPYGEIFNITDGSETTWKEYFTRLAATVNLAPPFSLPKDEIKLFLQLRHQGQKLFRKEADILPESVDFMTRPYAYSIAKAKNLLNYQPKINLDEGMQLTKQWLQQQ